VRFLGKILKEIEHDSHDDPMICASIILPSYNWLHGLVVKSLQNIGKGSHTLRTPAPCDTRIVGGYLRQLETDVNGWQEAKLPKPPVVPADTVLVARQAGVKSKRDAPTIGQQLCSTLPAQVLDYLDIGRTRIRAVIFAVDNGQGSYPYAQEKANLINNCKHEDTGEPMRRSVGRSSSGY